MDFKELVFNQLKVTNGKNQVPIIQEVEGKKRKGVFISRDHKYLDTKDFIKVYAEGFAFIFNLSNTAKKVLIPIIEQIRNIKDNNRLAFNYQILKKESKVEFSQSTFSRGLSELIESGFIREISKGFYEYNGTYLFNGDRIEFTKIYHVKSK